jgi:hypothetical protein
LHLKLLKLILLKTSFSPFRFVTLFRGARPMNEEADVSELDEAVERLRRNYQKPLFPSPSQSERQTANDEDAANGSEAAS